MTTDDGMAPADLKRFVRLAGQLPALTACLAPLLKRGENVGPHEQHAIVELLHQLGFAAHEASQVYYHHVDERRKQREARNGALVAAPKP